MESEVTIQTLVNAFIILFTIGVCSYLIAIFIPMLKIPICEVKHRVQNILVFGGVGAVTLGSGGCVFALVSAEGFGISHSTQLVVGISGAVLVLVGVVVAMVTLLAYAMYHRDAANHDGLIEGDLNPNPVLHRLLTKP